MRKNINFARILRGISIKLERGQVCELEAHNQELLNEWRINPKRKIYEWADSVPVKNQEDDNWLNLFSGFKFWEWGEFDDWIEEWCEEQRHWQCKEEKLNLFNHV